ncbi:hypothetical protein [Brevundimonas diminuta]|uniref:hypothetical protein n=1 Tax=Brevundimonas diminuta TaxID=293 RepID=UPI0030F7B3CF
MKRPLQHGAEGTDKDRVMAVMNGLAEHADTFAAIESSVRAIAELMPARVSLRQGLAFIFVVRANARGRRVTMTDVRQSFSETEHGSVSVGQSIAKSFQVFFEASKQEPNGLNWVRQEADADDRRKKYLVITAEGAEVARKMAAPPQIEGDEA